jgi:uncharacterized protein involved in exopolysaccharide biosynthesis
MQVEAGSDQGGSHPWKRVILIPTLAATLSGYLVSFLFVARYTSTSEVQVESPLISEAIVPHAYTLDLSQHMNEIWGGVKSPANLRSKAQTLGLAKPGQDLDDAVSDISDNSQVQAAFDIAQSTTASPAAFYVSYTGSTAEQARKVCEGLTSMLIEQDLKVRQEHSKETADFLTQQVADAQNRLNDLDVKIAALKNEHRNVSASLAIDYENARKVYQGDLTNKNNLDMANQAAYLALGGQMAILAAPSVPDAPDFPNRLSFAFGGFIAGLLLGGGLAFRLWFRNPARRLAVLRAHDQAT